MKIKSNLDNYLYKNENSINVIIKGTGPIGLFSLLYFD